MEIYEVDKSLARISEMEWRDVIHTRKGHEVQIRRVGIIHELGWIWPDQDMTIDEDVE